MDPLNARAAWSSVVGVLEHGERSQKNVVENIFEEFSAAVFDKLPKMITVLSRKNVASLTCCSMKWII